ncbi:hypothetical protein ES332_A10G138400v1 [Gossypium tomentosum]|uniref:Uncharacterized protein n=1 Tax=Gossypium tomentosum TaxID=34277 RepID=A0A5D2NR30_GOSTO|nr:hypothetical protein ES332_A10G138400v1 [Gossypium tomentosum]TYI06157.1 hypothetical protein ES332_A10G138400v1 [Gossypium tomentosum]
MYIYIVKIFPLKLLDLKFGCLCAVSMISRSLTTALVIEPSLSLWVSKMDQLHSVKEKYR